MCGTHKIPSYPALKRKRILLSALHPYLNFTWHALNLNEFSVFALLNFLILPEKACSHIGYKLISEYTMHDFKKWLVGFLWHKIQNGHTAPDKKQEEASS